MKTTFSPVLEINKHGALDHWLEVSTNFDIQEHPRLIILLTRVAGVEQCFATRRYEFSIIVGKVFSVYDVAVEIERTVNSYFETKDAYLMVRKFLIDIFSHRFNLMNLFILLFLSTTTALAQKPEYVNVPSYEFDTLIYRHAIILKASQPAYHFPPGCFLYEMEAYNKSGGIQVTGRNGGSLYHINMSTIFIVRATAKQDERGQWVYKPVKYGDATWNISERAMPIGTVKAVDGAAFELVYYSLKPIR